MYSFLALEIIKYQKINIINIYLKDLEKYETIRILTFHKFLIGIKERFIKMYILGLKYLLTSITKFI